MADAWRLPPGNGLCLREKEKFEKRVEWYGPVMRTHSSRLGFLAAGLLVVASWYLSFGKPLLSSHCDRQMQTADTAKVFVQEGWHPLLPVLRYFGKPGYAVMECPIYQSLAAGLCAVTKISMDASGRLISLLSAIAL